MTDPENMTLLRTILAPARALEPTEAEIERVVSRARTGSRRPTGGWRHLAAPALASLAFLGIGLYAVSATRAALGDAAGGISGVFSGWMSGRSADAPGRPLAAADRVPSYMKDPEWADRHVRDPRVIAAAGNYKLYAYLERGGTVGFDLGDTGVGMGGFSVANLTDRALFLLGPGSMRRADAAGHVPLFGIVAGSVSSVELTYDSGPPTRLDGLDGGFVLLVDPRRRPREVYAYDADGSLLGSAPVNTPGWDWLQYVG